jgi:hypothetical protein
MLMSRNQIHFSFLFALCNHTAHDLESFHLFEVISLKQTALGGDFLRLCPAISFFPFVVFKTKNFTSLNTQYCFENLIVLVSGAINRNIRRRLFAFYARGTHRKKL